MGNSQTLSCASGEKTTKGQRKEEQYTKAPKDKTKENGANGEAAHEGAESAEQKPEAGDEKPVEVAEGKEVVEVKSDAAEAATDTATEEKDKPTDATSEAASPAAKAENVELKIEESDDQSKKETETAAEDAQSKEDKDEGTSSQVETKESSTTEEVESLSTAVMSALDSSVSIGGAGHNPVSCSESRSTEVGSLEQCVEANVVSEKQSAADNSDDVNSNDSDVEAIKSIDNIQEQEKMDEPDASTVEADVEPITEIPKQDEDPAACDDVENAATTHSPTVSDEASSKDTEAPENILGVTEPSTIDSSGSIIANDPSPIESAAVELSECPPTTDELSCQDAMQQSEDASLPDESDVKAIDEASKLTFADPSGLETSVEASAVEDTDDRTYECELSETEPTQMETLEGSSSNELTIEEVDNEEAVSNSFEKNIDVSDEFTEAANTEETCQLVEAEPDATANNCTDSKTTDVVCEPEMEANVEQEIPGDVEEKDDNNAPEMQGNDATNELKEDSPEPKESAPEFSTTTENVTEPTTDENDLVTPAVAVESNAASNSTVEQKEEEELPELKFEMAPENMTDIDSEEGDIKLSATDPVVTPSPIEEKAEQDEDSVPVENLCEETKDAPSVDELDESTLADGDSSTEPELCTPISDSTSENTNDCNVEILEDLPRGESQTTQMEENTETEPEIAAPEPEIAAPKPEIAAPEPEIATPDDSEDDSANEKAEAESAAPNTNNIEQDAANIPRAEISVPKVVVTAPYDIEISEISLSSSDAESEPEEIDTSSVDIEQQVDEKADVSSSNSDTMSASEPVVEIRSVASFDSEPTDIEATAFSSDTDTALPDSLLAAHNHAVDGTSNQLLQEVKDSSDEQKESNESAPVQEETKPAEPSQPEQPEKTEE